MKMTFENAKELLDPNITLEYECYGKWYEIKGGERSIDKNHLYINDDIMLSFENYGKVWKIKK